MSGVAWRDLPERYEPWESIYSRFKKWLDNGILDNIFRILTLEADYENLSIDSTIVRAYQVSTGAPKKGGLSTKIHTIVDAFENPVYFQLYEGQEADSKYAPEVLDKIGIEGSNVLGDKGYDSNAILGYIRKRKR